MLGNSRSSIGAWQSSKVTIQYKHLKLLWAPSIGGKICLRISDISHWNFGELKSQNIAMKHEGHCMGLLRPTPFQLKFWSTILHLCFPASPIISCLRLLYKFFVLENFLLEIWTCVSRKYLLGVSIFDALFFCVFLCFSSNRFPKKKLREIGVQKDRFLFSSPHFYLKDWKTLDFLKDITSDKKKVVISSTSKNSSTFRKLI